MTIFERALDEGLQIQEVIILKYGFAHPIYHPPAWLGVKINESYYRRLALLKRWLRSDKPKVGAILAHFLKSQPTSPDPIRRALSTEIVRWVDKVDPTSLPGEIIPIVADLVAA